MPQYARERKPPPYTGYYILVGAQMAGDFRWEWRMAPEESWRQIWIRRTGRFLAPKSALRTRNFLGIIWRSIGAVLVSLLDLRYHDTENLSPHKGNW